jgi:hypothetical protein
VRNRLMSGAGYLAALVAILIGFSALMAFAATQPSMAESHRVSGETRISTAHKATAWRSTLASSRVDALGLSRSYRAAYGGVRVTPASRLLIDVVRNKSTAFDVALSSLLDRFPTVPYMVVTVRNSWMQLLSHQKLINGDWKRLGRHGIPISETWPDPASNKVHVWLRHYSSRARSALLDRYGARWIAVGNASHDVRLTPMGRFDDTSPFAGGDGIWYNSPTPPSFGFQCTSGFAISYTKSNGDQVDGFVSAAHCDDGVGDAVWTNHDNPVKIGGVSFHQGPCDGSHTDTEIFEGAAVGEVWGLNMGLKVVAGTVIPGKGDDVAFDGARTGEVDDVGVQKTNVSLEYDDTGCITNGLTQAHKDNTTVAQPGDSGGPVMVNTNNPPNVNAAGQIVDCLVVNGISDLNLFLCPDRESDGAGQRNYPDGG